MFNIDQMVMLLAVGITIGMLVLGSSSRVIAGIFVIWGSGVFVGCMKCVCGEGGTADLVAWLGFGWVASSVVCLLMDLVIVHSRRCFAHALGTLRKRNHRLTEEC